ncbi:MAG: ATP-binding protein [Polyangiaceae bacterium]
MTETSMRSDLTEHLAPILQSISDDRLLADLIETLPIGVVILDREGRVLRYNAYERQMANRTAESVLGRKFFEEIAPCTRVTELYPAFERYTKEGGVLSVDLQFQFPFPHLPAPRDVRLRLRGFDSRDRKLAFLLVEDITEEMEARRLRELLAMLVAHDMKNPLAALRLNVDMVLREIGTENVSSKLVDARMAADRLDRMLRLFLDVYRLEHADLVVSRSRVMLASLFGEVSRLQSPVAESFDIKLEFDETDEIIDTDASLLLRVIENLVDNAIRHAGSVISVRPRTEDGTLIIDVIDDGQGVPDHAKTRIFDKFASLSTDLRGYNQGLGLTFCSLAMRRLGGSVSVHDASPHGAIFRVRVPRE